ncbi:hypothetical protein Tco_0896455, partial [Tanacetum coccineum]
REEEEGEDDENMKGADERKEGEGESCIVLLQSLVHHISSSCTELAESQIAYVKGVTESHVSHRGESDWEMKDGYVSTLMFDNMDLDNRTDILRTGQRIKPQTTKSPCSGKWKRQVKSKPKDFKGSLSGVGGRREERMRIEGERRESEVRVLTPS